MTNKATQVYGISPEELKDEITNAIRQELNTLSKNSNQKKETILLTRQEISKRLNISLATELNWRKSGIITAYRIGNKIRYKESEILSALHKIESNN